MFGNSWKSLNTVNVYLVTQELQENVQYLLKNFTNPGYQNKGDSFLLNYFSPFSG